MTQLINYQNRLINDVFNDFFTPTFTRKISIDNKVLAEKDNYSIWELPSGKYEVRVQYSSESSSYHRATTRENLEDAKEYIETQLQYHSRQLEGPKKVWDGKEN